MDLHFRFSNRIYSGTCMLGFTFSLIVAFESRDIDTKNCETLVGGDGQFIQCSFGYLGVQLCGSGGDYNCAEGLGSTELVCCKEVVDSVTAIHQKKENSTRKYCESFSGSWGQQLVCSDTTVISSICGSGGDANCNGNSHVLVCCDDHNLSVDRNDASCSWLWGNFGELVSCREGDVGVGYCNAGVGRECNGGVGSHGIYCCPYE